MHILMIAGNVGNVKDVNDVNGDKVLNFSVAVDNGKDKNGEKRESTWYDCALWGKRAESLAPYITKGSKLAVSGTPGCRAYEGKAYLTLKVAELTFMSSKSDGEARSHETYDGGTRKPSDAQAAYDLNDSIPF